MAQPVRAEPTQAVDRAVALLRAVADAPAPLSALELAERCSLTRSTAWRLLQALERHGLVERDAARRYRIGHEVIRLAAGVDGQERLRAAARPVLEALMRETGATVNLNVLTAGGIVSIDQVSPPTVLAVDWVGIVAPLHATPSGKAALAAMPAAERARCLSGPLPRLASGTVTDPARLDAEIDAVAARGWATIEDEFEDDLNGVAATVYDPAARPAAYVTVWGTTRSLPAGRFPAVGERLRSAADDIRRRLR
jgi:DNA-binding IclR family transcriptional regulator